MRTNRIQLSAAITTMFAVTGALAYAHIGHWLPVTNIKAQTLNTSQIDDRQRAETAAIVSDDKKTLTYSGKSINLVIKTGPEDDMLSYRIAGLRNAALVVPHDATVNILFVNGDEDMTHDLRFTAAHPPFTDTPDRKDSVGSSIIAHAEKGSLHGEQFTMRAAKAGDYTYFCSVKGHAKGGMFGVLQVK